MYKEIYRLLPISFNDSPVVIQQHSLIEDNASKKYESIKRKLKAANFVRKYLNPEFVCK